jgi:undecaprenyl-diphosphatase
LDQSDPGADVDPPTDGTAADLPDGHASTGAAAHDSPPHDLPLHDSPPSDVPLSDVPDDGIETVAPEPDELLHSAQLPHEIGSIAAFDARASALFDRWRGREPYDRIFYAATELGDFGLIWLLMGAAKALRSDRDFQAAVRLYTCLGVESVVINGVVKSLFKRERPVQQEERPYHIRIPLTTSFPSGHASSAMVAACLLSDGSRIGPAYFALGLLVASSRVYVRIHHPSDVIGGLAVGTGLGLLARKLWKIPPRRP